MEARRLRKADNKGTRTVVWKIDTQFQNYWTMLASNYPLAEEALLAFDKLVTAILDGPEGRRIATDAERRLQSHMDRISTIEARETSADKLRILAAMSHLERLKNLLDAR